MNPLMLFLSANAAGGPVGVGGLWTMMSGVAGQADALKEKEQEKKQAQSDAVSAMNAAMGDAENTMRAGLRNVMEKRVFGFS